jgi:hypothetical protein
MYVPDLPFPLPRFCFATLLTEPNVCR